MKLSALAMGAAALALTAGAALAEYPEKPVNFIVPWPPGDLEDVLTRMIAEDFQKEYGVAAAVVNKPGGGGGPFPGAIEVANAPADGYTIGSFVIGVPVIGHEIDIPPLTPAKFDPLGIFLTYPFVIATSADAPYGSMEELAAYAKENEVALGHFGDVLTPTQVTKAFAVNAGFEWGSDAAFDALDCNTLASGDADVINTTLALIEPCLGEINVLANIGAQPIAKLEGVQTLSAQSGINDLELWNGLFVKKGTPQEVIDKLDEIASATMSSAEAQALMAETGARVYWQNMAESKARIETDRGKNAELTAIIDK